MVLASYIKTACDKARPRHVAKIIENHDAHGWLIAALLREKSGLAGKATFECVESETLAGECRSSPFAGEDGHTAPGLC